MICELCAEQRTALTNGACSECLGLLDALSRPNESAAGRTTAKPEAPSSNPAFSALASVDFANGRLLAGKIAIITGGNRGIGRAIAERMLDHGADVHIIDIQEHNFDSLQRYADERGRHCTQVVADVTDDAMMRQVISDLGRENGRIDVLVNNAGVFHGGRFDEYSRADWDHQFAVNVTAPFVLSQAVVPWMPPNSGAGIVNLASVAGKTASAFNVGYTASKHAIVGLTRALALDVAPLGINVNAIAPGFVDTDMLAQIVNELAPLAGNVEPQQMLSGLIESVPQKRLVAPRDVAELAVFLAAPVSASITGQIINVSGGWLVY